MPYLLKYNGVVLPDTLRPSERPFSYDLGESELPRGEGSLTQAARPKSRTLTVMGDVAGEDPDTLEAALDALKGAWSSGLAAPLYFGRDDQYYLAQVVNVAESSTEGLLWGLVHSLSVSFLAASPFALSPTPQTIHFQNGQSPWTLDPDATTGGDVPVLPLWTITVGQGGTGPLTLTNTTTGETCSLSPIPIGGAAGVGGVAGAWAAGDVLTANRDGHAVALDGAAAFGMLSGRIPRLVPGVNTITLTAGGTASVGAFSATYTPRWP